jgi:phosphonate transport system substrate-binding protein
VLFITGSLQVLAAGFSLDTVRPPEIVIGLGPLGPREEVKQGAMSVAKLLQNEIGIPVKIYLAKNYSNLAKSVRDKKVDFVFLSAASYVLLEKDTHLQVLLKHVWQEPFYYSSLISLKNSGFNKLEELKGKKVAFVDKRSTSGYLYPQVMLQKRKMSENFFSETRFSASHSESVKLLKHHEVDAIFVFSDDSKGLSTAWNKFSEGATEEIQVLWVSDAIPNDPFCVRQEFYEKYPKTVHSVMYSLIDAHEKLTGQPGVIDVLSAKGFLPATSRQYDPVRDMVKQLGISRLEEL